MIDQQIEIQTRDGKMSTFISHPERGGPHPVIVFYMDAPGIREELRDMARRLATSGYYVMLPHLYYRAGGDMELGPILPARSANAGADSNDQADERHHHSHDHGGYRRPACLCRRPACRAQRHGRQPSVTA